MVDLSFDLERGGLVGTGVTIVWTYQEVGRLELA